MDSSKLIWPSDKATLNSWGALATQEQKKNSPFPVPQKICACIFFIATTLVENSMSFVGSVVINKVQYLVARLNNWYQIVNELWWLVCN
jgi:hypothetical protein